MPIILPSGVANAKGTPAIISDDVNIASLPASDYAAGTLYIDYDRSVIYSNYQSSSWILIADVGGGGGGGTLQQVLDAGNQALNQSIELYENTGYNSNIISSNLIAISDTNSNTLTSITSNQVVIQNIGNNQFSILGAATLYLGVPSEELYSNHYVGGWNIRFRNNDRSIIAQASESDGQKITLRDIIEGEQVTVGNYYFEFRDIASDKTQTIYPSNQNYNNQLIFLPEDTGTLALQDPPYYDALLDLSAGSITPNIDKNSIIQIIVGDAINSINLDKDRWKDKVTLTICNKATTTARVDVTNGFFYGNSNVLGQGLFYITYLDSTESFYITG